AVNPVTRHQATKSKLTFPECGAQGASSPILAFLAMRTASWPADSLLELRVHTARGRWLSRWFRLTDLPLAVTAAASVQGGADVYFGLAPRRHKNTRVPMAGTDADVLECRE